MPIPYDINTNKTYVGSEIAKSAMLSVARGQSNMVLVCSDGGFRKTYEAKRILRVNKVPFIEEAPQTDAVLVRYLYGIESGLRTFRGIKPLVLVADDTDAGLTRPSMLNVYKSAWGSDRRMVFFKSTEVEKNEGYKSADTEAKRKRYDPSIPPSSFPVTVRLIQLSNNNYTDPAIIDKMGVHFRALVTKGLDPIWIPNDAEHDGRDVFIWTCWLATEGNSLRSEGFSLAVSRLALDFYCTHPHRLIDLSPRRLTLIARAYRDNPPGDQRDRALARMLGEDQRPKLKLPETWVPMQLWPQEPPRRNPNPPPDPQPDPDPPKPPAQRPDAAVVSLSKFRRQSEPTPPMADPPPPVSPPETATGPIEPDRTDAAPKPPPEPRAEELLQEPPRTENEVLDLIYRRKQIETCESVADALRHVPMQDWEPDEFDRLAENLEAHAQWGGDHNDIAHEFVMFAGVPVLFGTADAVLFYEDGLKVMTWAQAMERVAPQVEEGKCRREAERRRQEGRQIISSRLPAKRKLAAMKTRLEQLTALQPTTISQEAALAIDFIRAMLKDDERFADCRTFYDYLLKAIEITLPPPPKNDAREPSDLASMWDSNPTATARDLPEPDCTDDTTEQSHAAVETPAPDTEVSKTDDLILDHPLPTADRKQAFFGAANCCRHLTENDQAIVQWIGWLMINDADLMSV